jgi:hypothetical protein
MACRGMPIRGGNQGNTIPDVPGTVNLNFISVSCKRLVVVIRLMKDETHLKDHYINSIASHTDLSTPTSSSALTPDSTVTITKGIV